MQFFIKKIQQSRIDCQTFVDALGLFIAYSCNYLQKKLSKTCKIEKLKVTLLSENLVATKKFKPSHTIDTKLYVT